MKEFFKENQERASGEETKKIKREETELAEKEEKKKIEKVKSKEKQEKEGVVVSKVKEIGKNKYEISVKFLGQETFERIAPQRIKLDEDEPAQEIVVTKDLTYTNPSGKSFNFKDLLPSHAYFVKAVYNKNSDFLGVQKDLREDENIGCCHFFADPETGDYAQGKILVLYNSFENIGDRLILLHELGHVANRKKFVNQIQEKIEDLAILQNKAQSQERQEGGSQEILVRLLNSSDQEVPTPLPRSLYIAYAKLRAADERNAWAFALRELRKLRQEGIDLEPALDNLDEIEEIIDDALMSYQEDFSHRVLSSTIYNQFLKKIFCRKEELFYKKKRKAEK